MASSPPPSQHKQCKNSSVFIPFLFDRPAIFKSGSTLLKSKLRHCLKTCICFNASPRFKYFKLVHASCAKRVRYLAVLEKPTFSDMVHATMVEQSVPLSSGKERPPITCLAKSVRFILSSFVSLPGHENEVKVK